jgi:AraC-like DNA-binding protein
MIPPAVIHREMARDRFTRYIAVFIDEDFFKTQLSHYPSAAGVAQKRQFISMPFETMSLVKEFMVEIDNQLPGWEQIARATSVKLCHGIIRNLLQMTKVNGSAVQCLEIRNTIDYMHAHIDQKITIEALAKIARMSKSYFIRNFKKETGQSAINYLNQIRLEQVKRLLLEERQSMTEIALACGFNSAAYLSSSFYKKFNMTPSDYQKLFKKGDNV